MSAIVIGMMAYVMVAAVVAVVIVAGLSLLAWFVGAAPTRLHGSQSLQPEDKRTLPLRELAQKV